MDCVELCAAVLQWHCTANTSAASSLAGPQKTAFHSCRVPPISVADYVARISRYSKCSPECCAIALVYMDRFLVATSTPLTLFNVHRMILIAVMIAAKLRDDIYFSNGYYGSIGGIPREEVNRLEVAFLATLDWKLWVEPLDYWDYLEQSVLKVRCASQGPSMGLSARPQLGQNDPPRQAQRVMQGGISMELDDNGM